MERPIATEPWVVGIDGSTNGEHALDWALAHAAHRTTCLHLVTAWQTPIYGAQAETWPVTAPVIDRELLAASAQRIADEAAARATTRTDIQIESSAPHGGPTAALLQAAEGAALLVIGSRGRGGFQRLLLGSTSTQCATHATAPVVVVPARADIVTTEHIVVGVDGSASSIAALDWALTFAEPSTTVEALSVWDASPLAAGADQFFFPEATDLAEERFRHLIDGVEARHRHNHPVVRTFLTGVPRRVLLERAAAADLLVVGGRGHGAIGAALIGSVSTWLLHHVSVPVVVIPGHDA